MLIPYRAKNPVKRFPIATVSLIVLNVIVFLFTTHMFLVIKEGVVKDFACLVGVSPLYTYITSFFLHADPLHLIGNMLFLWVFGPSVEDRLGIPKYLGLYFITGVVGSLLQTALAIGLGGQNLPSIGASGCIMGVVGAYWYMYSWSPICCAYWFGWFYRGLADIKAFWVIGFYMLMNIFDGAMSSASGVSGGVANFAHIGGTVAGALLCLAFRIPRDTSEVSEAKAIHSDAKDIYNVPLHALESMMAADPHNLELIHAVVTRAVKTGEINIIKDAMTNAGTGLIDKDPALVAYYIVDLKGDLGIYRSIHLLRLAGLLERNGNPSRASQVYFLIVNARPTDPESETALYRLAMFAWNVQKDANRSREFICELQRRFPHGEMVIYGNALLKKIG